MKPHLLFPAKLNGRSCGRGAEKTHTHSSAVYAGRRKTESIQNGFIIINYSNAPGVGPYTKYVEQ